MSTAARWHRWTPERAADGAEDPSAAAPEQLDRAVALLAGRRLAVLTGAGLSTDSGIPDYRGPTAKPRTPMTYQQFIGDARMRRHYWARNHVGYRFMSATRPNDGHRAVARLESRGLTSGVITQNIDRLHEAAGALNVVDLHGRFDHVVCLDCGSMVQRAELDRILTDLNPGFAEAVMVEDVEVAPDADAVIESTAGFVVAPCPVCGGVLKPDVTFFGENVPRDRVARSYGMVDSADGLLVAGSSLAVMSGLRFVRRAHQRGRPVVIINRGQTRGDDRASLLLHAGVSEALTHLAERLPEL